ncbi:MAG: YaeQ family protein [Polyangiaceae bacterium]|nr:YaeQ family protein [Polyangiaceae bacterium]
MGAAAIVRRFDVQLADSDRGVYEALELRTAQHPSESPRYLVARVLARALEHDDGVEFSRGLAEAEDPALWQRDLSGSLRAWIEVGAPSPARLHRAQKACPRVVVYGWKAVPRLAEDVVTERVHRASELTLYALDPALLDALASGLDRQQRWDVSVAGGVLYVGVGGQTHEGAVTRVPVAAQHGVREPKE